MKTWEMIKELTENPNKKFICDDIITEVKRSSEIHITHNVTGKDFGACINDEWEEVKQSVDFMTAVHSGRRIKVEHKYVDKYLITDFEKYCEFEKYQHMKCVLKFLVEKFMPHIIREIIIDGNWYIED